jgi:GNAT superfamily N-acetyltransferase
MFQGHLTLSAKISEASDKERPPVFELDNPVWWAIAGSQRELGTATPLAARFHPEISPFGAFSEEPTAGHWEDLAGLVGPGGAVALTGEIGRPPSGWTILRELDGVQMLGDQVGPRPARSSREVAPADTPLPLGVHDVADMLALVAETQPGPFLPRTIEFGGYLGVRRKGRLIAMGGERMRPPGYAEISAVATDPSQRHQGLAEILIRSVVAAMLDRGEVPFLHASSGNAGAIRLYERMGFTPRRTVSFLVVQAPGDR